MTHIGGKPASLLFGIAIATSANAMADTDSDSNGDTDSDATESVADTDTPKAAKAAQPDSTAVDRHWQFSIALNLYSYQRATFNVEPINSGRSFPGTLERTNIGPSGSPVLIEPGYVIGNRLVLGMLLDLGSGLMEIKIKGLSFEIAESSASLAIGPRVAYLFAPNSSLCPFATVALGYGSTPSTAAAQGLRLTEYQGFAGAGLSYFVAEAFSFDTSVRAAYGIASGYVDSGVLKNAGLSGSIYTLMWTLGTTGWLK
jgi:hypothetical protein